MNPLVKAIAINNEVRILLIRTDDLVNEAILRHDLWPSAASVLGKALTIGALMGSMLKGQEALTIKMNGNGPVGSVIVDATSTPTVRGYVDHPHVHFSKNETLDDASTLGINGSIDVIKDLGLKDLFTSSVPLQFGELAKDFTYYFASSEQTPTVVSLGIKMDEGNKCVVSGGLILQLLPLATEDTIVAVEKKLPLFEHLSEQLLQTSSLEELLSRWFGEDVEILDRTEARFFCPCSKEKFAGGIVSLGKKDIESLIIEQSQAEIVCHYCNEKYLFTKEELNVLLKEIPNE